ncbi:MAG: hypothetical protein DCF21_04760 [Leptolyngbya sp.]|nr:MAG: hypothetical protein DCF21_04760 [Leptolyngbya sp.]
MPGATSASATANAQASDQGAAITANVSVPAGEQSHSSEPTTNSAASESEEEPAIGETVSDVNETPQPPPVVAISLLLGNPDNNLLANTAQQDIFWGGAGADIFQLSSTGVAELTQADIILDYSPAAGDHLAISDALTAEALIFGVLDFSGDGAADSTVVRSSIDNTILAVVLNTVNELGETLLSTADFLDPAAVEAWVASNPSPELETEAESGTSGSSQTSSSSSAFVDGSGAGSSSSATATSPTDETSTSSETVYTPGALSSGGSATATANAEGVNTTASAQAPLLDVLIGTAENDVLVGTNNRNIFIGNGGTDIFVLPAIKKTSLETADIIVDFSPEQGDLIQLPSGIAFSDITLQAVDIDSNGTLDGTSIGAVETGAIYAIVLNTVDIFGTSTLATDSFVTPNFA